MASTKQVDCLEPMRWSKHLDKIELISVKSVRSRHLEMHLDYWTTRPRSRRGKKAADLRHGGLLYRDGLIKQGKTGPESSALRDAAPVSIRDVQRPDLMPQRCSGHDMPDATSWRGTR